MTSLTTPNPQRDFELVADTPLLLHDAVTREKPQTVNSYNDAHLRRLRLSRLRVLRDLSPRLFPEVAIASLKVAGFS